MAERMTGKVQAFSVPFPPSILSPNSRKHWSKKVKPKKEFQRAVWAMMKQQNIRPMGDGSIDLHLTFYPPADYNYDDDNLVAAFKAARDTIASVIGVDDKVFRLQPPVIEGKEPPHGRVAVTLRPTMIEVPIVGVVADGKVFRNK